MTYDEAVAFWYARVNYEAKAAAPTDLKLERMRALLRRLGDPHLRLRVVHLAGTKGKGSTAALLEAAVRAAGYRTGLFTSPHLERVEERIQVNRELITSGELAARLTEIRPHAEAMERAGAAPTFFELTTAVGFLHFAYRRVELAIVEVGLGGLFDSTNVVDPVATAITSIGLDHQAQLGHTVELIAAQKAGIIKPRVPVVLGPLDAGPRRVILGIAKSQRAPVVDSTGIDLGDLNVGLAGEHQRENAKIALGLIRVLRQSGLAIGVGPIQAGFSGVDWPARVEILNERPRVVVDSAHNVPSVVALLRTLESGENAAQILACREKRHLVFAVSGDKQYREMLALLLGHFGVIHLTRFATSMRSVDPDELATICKDYKHSTRITTHPSGAEAWEVAFAAVPSDGAICVTGSAFLAGELRTVVLTSLGRLRKAEDGAKLGRP